MSQAQKTPLSRALSLMVDAYILKQMDKLGRELPCQVEAIDATGTIVTVSFQVQGVQMPQVTMPVFGPEFIRYPIQVGSMGVCFAADTYLGQVSGLGTGVAGPTRRANLSTLVFFPIGNANLDATDDANALVMYGPNGVILRDSDSNSVVTLTPADIDIDAQTNLTGEAGSEIQFSVGSNSVLINTTEIECTVGSNTVLINASEIVLTVGAAILTMTAAGIVSSVPITAPALTAVTSLQVAGKEMSGHEHHVAGITTGGSTVTSSAPI